MKAYKASLEGEEWMQLVHGKTRGQAKYNFYRWNPESDSSYWNDIRLTRLPEYDDKPFVDSPEIRELFTPSDYDEAGDGIYNEKFFNDCYCEICRPELYRKE